MTKELIKKSDNESDNESVNESVNESNSESDNKSVNKGTADWSDKNKFNKILTTVDNSNFNHKNKIGKLNLMALTIWSIILKMMQLVKQILKRK